MGLRCHPRQLSRTPDSVVAVDNKIVSKMNLRLDYSEGWQKVDSFPVVLRVLIQCLLSEDNLCDRSDRVSCLVSGINPGSVVGGQLGRSFRIGFPVWLRVLIMDLLFQK